MAMYLPLAIVEIIDKLSSSCDISENSNNLFLNVI